MRASSERPAEGYFQVTRRVNAAEALGLLGPKAKAAIPVLRRLCEHEDDRLAAAATRALERIETD
jgi:HEAT repeat protein